MNPWKNTPEATKPKEDVVTYCKPTQKTFRGKGPAHYIDNATVAVAESGNYELFYGKDIVLLLNASNNLVVVGAG